MDKIKLPLEAILPESLKQKINESLEIFVKGISITQNRKNTYYLDLGYLELDDVIIYTDSAIFDIICQEVSRYFDIPLSKLLDSDKRRFYCEKRQLIQTFTLKYTKLTSQEIADLTNRKTHAAVLNARKVVNELVSTDSVFAYNYNIIEDKIKSRVVDK